MWKRQCQKTSEDCKGHEKGCGDNNSHHQESLDGSKSIVATANPGMSFGEINFLKAVIMQLEIQWALGLFCRINRIERRCNGASKTK